MLVDAACRGGHPFDPRLVLREAQYPVKAVSIADPDGAPLYLAFY
jgi:hypothetical protein